MRRPTRRAFLVATLAGFPGAAQKKGALFEPDWKRYSDPTTEFPVYRLTGSGYSSRLPAYYQRCISRRGGFLLCACDRSGSLQAHRLDLKTGESRQLTEAEALDGSSLALSPDERRFWYFDGPILRTALLSNLRDRDVYRVPAGWQRTPGMSLVDDGNNVLFGEQREDTSRLRMVGSRGALRTIVEQPWEIGHPLARPRRAQVLYRQGDQALWLVNMDGRQNRRLTLAEGRVGPADWSRDGRLVLYLNLPADTRQLNAIRECTPDQNTDRPVGKTSQFQHFGFNRDNSVFVGASRNAASPTVLLLLRVTQREFTLCEHRASDPGAVAPIFSPDSRRIYFNSDRDGKPAIYCMVVEKIVEETEDKEP